MSLNSLTVSWEHTNATLDYTYCNLSLRHFSCIDHFVLGAVIFESISSSYVKSDPTNVSTHNAVITEFGLELQYDNCASRISTNRDNFSLWYKATEYDICNYKNMLDTELSKVHVPANLTTCSEIDCSSVVHARFINNLCNAVVNTCIHCSKLCIPQSTPNRKRSKPIPY